MKKYFFIATTALLLASCQSDDFIGNTQGSKPDTSNAAITFDGETGKISRATEGAEAAKLLNNNFVVYGYKTKDNTASVVYNYYNVNWAKPSSKTESSSTTEQWLYDGQTKNALNTANTAPASETTQTLKYWDYSASQYDFVAFSFGEAKQGTESSTDDNTVVAKFTMEDNSAAVKSYTLTGKASELVKCYVADKATAKASNSITVPSNTQFEYNKPIAFNFHSMATKVQLKIYETIPGYSVKDIQFYSSNEDKNPSSTPTLFANDKQLPATTDKATVTVTFGDGKNEGNDLNLAKYEWSLAEDASKTESITFGTKLTNPSTTNGARLTRATESDYIGINSTNPSYSEPITIIPTNAGELTLKVNYTLVSDDGSGETITVTGANVKIKSDYTDWKGNTIYTYIFKISDNTNGSTGSTDVTGLYPITFDAVVTEPGTGSTGSEIEIVKDNTTENKGE